MLRIVCLLGVLSCAFINTVVIAALPVAVDGQVLPSLAPMLEEATPAVVNIATRSTQKIAVNPLLDDPFFQRFFNLPRQRTERQTQSSGSGVIVDAKNGYIITNFHVIDSADEITVTLRDGRKLQAKLLGQDPQADIAVIQVKVEGLDQLQWADSEALRVGDFVVAIGNPFGLGQTVTSGIVSALGRSGLGIEDFEDFIQTDASINPGNSGGALVDLNGKLVGINTAIVGPSGGSVGIGFAIPSNMVQQILDHLIRFGKVKRGHLGISSQELTPQLAKAFSISNANGVVIIDVVPNSPADKANLVRGDVVVEVGGHQVRNADSVRNIMGLLLVGQKVNLKVVRDSKELEVEMTVSAFEDRTRGRFINQLLKGVQFRNQESRSGRHFIVITEIESGSYIESYGLQVGDIILSVNRKAVSSVAELQKSIQQDDGRILLNVQRNRTAQYVLIQ